MTGRVLVAGIGNIFLGDDGFGVEVTRRLDAVDLPDHVKVEDFGIRGVHLAYELMDGYDTAILVDAVPRGNAPGTVYVIEPQLDASTDAVRAAASPVMDAHSMEPTSVLRLVNSMGGAVDRILIVGCEPGNTDEGIGLSPEVEGAIDDAVQLVRDLVAGDLAISRME